MRSHHVSERAASRDSSPDLYLSPELDEAQTLTWARGLLVGYVAEAFAKTVGP